MNCYYYNRVHWDEKLSYNSRIVYSCMFNRSFFFGDDKIDNVRESGYDITRAYDRHDDYNFVDVTLPISYADLAKSLNMTERTFYNTIDELKECEYLESTKNGYALYFVDGINQKYMGEGISYFKLYTETGLSGINLIVYSYLYTLTKVSDKDSYQKSALAGKFSLDKFRSHIIQDLDISVDTYKRCSAHLTKLGLISHTKVKSVNGKMKYYTIVEPPHRIEKQPRRKPQAKPYSTSPIKPEVSLYDFSF